jgi:hypothetical protein
MKQRKTILIGKSNAKQTTSKQREEEGNKTRRISTAKRI